MALSLEQHERIKMQLRLVGSSLSAVARELGVRATTVTCVSQGHRRSRRIEAAIAQKLGLLPDRLWQDRSYGPQTHLSIARKTQGVGEAPSSAH